MPTIGILTALLKPEHIVQGYGLSEDEDFLYLHKDDKVIATFSSHGASIGKVEAVIQSRGG